MNIKQTAKWTRRKADKNLAKRHKQKKNLYNLYFTQTGSFTKAGNFIHHLTRKRRRRRIRRRRRKRRRRTRTKKRRKRGCIT